MYRNRDHLTALADRCEAGAERLAYEAEHAAEVMATRANGSQLDPQQWAADKRAAAAAARQYAEGLRAEAAGLSGADRLSEERVQQAEKVARAAELGGILIDGVRLAAAALENPMASAEQRQAVREYQQAQRAAIEGSGLFEHVADEGQVPFWQLRHTDSAQNTPAAEVTTDTTATADITATADADAGDGQTDDGWEA